MLISIVTISFNCKDSIVPTLQSILMQDYKLIEIIIIDGNSVDGTKDLILDFQPLFENKGWLFKFVSESDSGIYDAMNKAIDLCTGDWVNFMNSGDSFYDSNVITSIANYVSLGQEFDVLYGNTLMQFADYDIIKYPKPMRLMSYEMINCHQSTFVKSEIMRKYHFSLEYKIAGDYNLFYTLYSKGHTFKYIDSLISKFDAKYGVSSKNTILARLEDLHINGRYNSFSGKCYLFKVFFKQSIKRILPVFVLKLYREYSFRSNKI